MVEPQEIREAAYFGDAMRNALRIAARHAHDVLRHAATVYGQLVHYDMIPHLFNQCVVELSVSCNKTVTTLIDRSDGHGTYFPHDLRPESVLAAVANRNQMFGFDGDCVVRITAIAGLELLLQIQTVLRRAFPNVNGAAGADVTPEEYVQLHEYYREHRFLSSRQVEQFRNSVTQELKRAELRTRELQSGWMQTTAATLAIPRPAASTSQSAESMVNAVAAINKSSGPLSRIDVPGIRNAICLLYRVIEHPNGNREWVTDAANETGHPFSADPAELCYSFVVQCAIDLVIGRLMPSGVHTNRECTDITDSNLDLKLRFALLELRSELNDPFANHTLANDRGVAIQFLTLLERVLADIEPLATWPSGHGETNRIGTQESRNGDPPTTSAERENMLSALPSQIDPSVDMPKPPEADIAAAMPFVPQVLCEMLSGRDGRVPHWQVVQALVDRRMMPFVNAQFAVHRWATRNVFELWQAPVQPHSPAPPGSDSYWCGGQWHRHNSRSNILIQPTPALWEQFARSTTTLTKTKRARKRASRATNLERLKNALIDHLRSAREHAYSTKQATGTPILLPRPQKSELGRQAGIKPDAVTRCFQDPTAKELLILWETCLDLGAIMNLSKKRRAIHRA